MRYAAMLLCCLLAAACDAPGTEVHPGVPDSPAGAAAAPLHRADPQITEIDANQWILNVDADLNEGLGGAWYVRQAAKLTREASEWLRANPGAYARPEEAVRFTFDAPGESGPTPFLSISFPPAAIFDQDLSTQTFDQVLDRASAAHTRSGAGRDVVADYCRKGGSAHFCDLVAVS
jgi:hypothetical protein